MYLNGIGRLTKSAKGGRGRRCASIWLFGSSRCGLNFGTGNVVEHPLNLDILRFSFCFEHGVKWHLLLRSFIPACSLFARHSTRYHLGSLRIVFHGQQCDRSSRRTLDVFAAWLFCTAGWPVCSCRLPNGEVYLPILWLSFLWIVARSYAPGIGSSRSLTSLKWFVMADSSVDTFTTPCTL
jgi:hypothetical protein